MELKELNISMANASKTFGWEDKVVTVKQYLSVNDKLDLISWIINQSADDLKFYNVGKLNVFLVLGLIKYYTDVEIADEEITPELYDLFISSGFYKACKNLIPSYEFEWIQKTLFDTVDSIYKYQNSIMGILDTVTTDYKDLNFDVEQLQKNISNPENLTLLKDVVTKLG